MDSNSFSVLRDNQKQYRQTAIVENPYASESEKMKSVRCCSILAVLPVLLPLFLHRPLPLPPSSSFASISSIQCSQSPSPPLVPCTSPVSLAHGVTLSCLCWIPVIASCISSLSSLLTPAPAPAPAQIPTSSSSSSSSSASLLVADGFAVAGAQGSYGGVPSGEEQGRVRCRGAIPQDQRGRGQRRQEGQ